MEIIVSIALVAVVAFIGYKILQKQRANNEAKYPQDNGPLTKEQVQQIVETAPKPKIEKPVEEPAKEFTGFPKSQAEPSKKPARKPRQKKNVAGDPKPKSTATKTKTKKTK